MLFKVGMILHSVGKGWCPECSPDPACLEVASQSQGQTRCEVQNQIASGPNTFNDSSTIIEKHAKKIYIPLILLQLAFTMTTTLYSGAQGLLDSSYLPSLSFSTPYLSSLTVPPTTSPTPGNRRSREATCSSLELTPLPNSVGEHTHCRGSGIIVALCVEGLHTCREIGDKERGVAAV